MRKLLAVLICIAVIASGAVFVSCSNGKGGEEAAQSEKAVNPNVSYKTLEEAEEAAGFKMQLPEKIKTTSFTVIDGKILEVKYEGGYIRKAQGADDISGDHNQYEKTEKKTVNNEEVTLKKNGDKIYLATWTHFSYTFCLGSDKGLSEKDITNMIEQIR